MKASFQFGSALCSWLAIVSCGHPASPPGASTGVGGSNATAAATGTSAAGPATSGVGGASGVAAVSTTGQATTTSSNGVTTTGANTTTTSGVGGTTPWVEPVENVDINELPSDVPEVKLEVDQGAMDQLDQNPFYADDVVGAFTDSSGTRYDGIDVNYRGAYQLRNLILDEESNRRNWKLKFSNEQKYRQRREWNYNYEPHLRQKLAYDLMRFAGVKVPSARHVRLVVNGEAHGLYLEYEDPDNKDWLSEKFADNDGDLYKASTDLPDTTPKFGTTEYLGDNDADYIDFWQKKLNNNDADATNFTRLREFLGPLNSTPSAEFPAFIEATFDVAKFIRYLVVTNFISHWDSMPQRPKNYWLYEIPEAGGRWVFIPWDMDATFQVEEFPLNPMGTDCSIYYQFDGYEEYELSPNEGTERPLVRRLMEHQQFRDAYVNAYRDALGSYLNRDYLIGRVNALESLLVNNASDEDRELVQESSAEIRDFVNQRYDNVSGQVN